MPPPGPLRQGAGAFTLGHQQSLLVARDTDSQALAALLAWSRAGFRTSRVVFFNSPASAGCWKGRVRGLERIKTDLRALVEHRHCPLQFRRDHDGSVKSGGNALHTGGTARTKLLNHKRAC